MKVIKSFDQFLTEKVQEVQKSEVQKEVQKEVSELKPNMREEYQKFFKEKLKKFGATGIGALGDKRSEFFKEIKAEWHNHKETLIK